MDKKNYYAIIPANVRYDSSLTPNAKLLYGEITALCNEKGYCWSSNSYFSDLYQRSKGTVSRWIASLEKQGYIKTELIYAENSKEVKSRKIFLTPMGINEYTYGQKCGEGIGKNDKDNNTSINNTINKPIGQIPNFEDFLNYALEKKENLCEESVRLKYDSWIENGWKTGKDRKIKNWKSSLLNTIPYLKEKEKKVKLNATNPNRK